MTQEIPRGRFVWYDLMTPDLDPAVAFYTALAGWGTSVWEAAAGMPYTMWMRGEAPLGGLRQLPAEAAAAGAPPHWLAYVAVPDVDATAARAVERGGQLRVPPTDIPTVGRFAILVDPQGAQLAVFTPTGEAPGHDGPPELGEISWHELVTTDPEAAFAFYEDLFGWRKHTAHDMGELGVYQTFGRTELPFGGFCGIPPGAPPQPFWSFYVRVPDVAAAARAVEQAGGKILYGPMEVPGGDQICQFFDPQGAIFAVHERKCAQDGAKAD